MVAKLPDIGSSPRAVLVGLRGIARAMRPDWQGGRVRGKKTTLPAGQHALRGVPAGRPLRLQAIDPAVYLTIDTMKVGHISKPLPYRTERQKEAVRIIYFKGKISPHQANLKDDWHRIQSAALAEKKDKAISKWFVKARQDVFINIDPSYNYCKLLE